MAVKVRRIVKQEVEIPGLGEKLRQARLKDQRSVEKLATAAGISRNYWYQLEAEAVLGGVKEETLRNIEQVLDVDLGVNFQETLAS
jgi:transcriptional regulator with XRE-family HTH domain